MSIDTSALGVLTARLMDFIADEYGDNIKVGTVAVIAEINGPDWTIVRYGCSDQRRWIQAGFFAAAEQAVRLTSEAEAEDE